MFDEIKMLQISFIMIRIIHKIRGLLKKEYNILLFF